MRCQISTCDACNGTCDRAVSSNYRLAPAISETLNRLQPDIRRIISPIYVASRFVEPSVRIALCNFTADTVPILFGSDTFVNENEKLSSQIQGDTKSDLNPYKSNVLL